MSTVVPAVNVITLENEAYCPSPVAALVEIHLGDALLIENPFTEIPDVIAVDALITPIKR